MIRKLRLKIAPSAAARTVAGLRRILDDIDRWPRTWDDPRQALAPLLTQAADESDEISAVIEQISDDSAVVHVSARTGVIEVSVDLVALFEQPRDQAAVDVALLLHLVALLRETPLFEATAYEGASRVTPARLAQALRREARAHRVRPPRVVRSTPAEDDEDPHRDDAPDDDDDDAADDDDEDSSSSTRRDHARERGGLDDDATTGGLSDAESFFLRYTDTTWPCREESLRSAFRRAAHLTHPDKVPDDDGARHRFHLIQTGYQSLKRRLEARGS